MAFRIEADSRSGAVQSTDIGSGAAFLARLLLVLGLAAVAFLLWSFLT
jgi:hypothetical protein